MNVKNAKTKNCIILSVLQDTTIGLLQQTITWYKIRHAGGHAHYYSRTGTLKQRDLNQSSVTGPLRE